MLNIFNLKLKNSYKNRTVNKKTRTTRPKKFGPFVRDWKNSIYLFNKNTLSNIAEASRLTNILIKGYFNLYSLKLEEKVKKKLGRKLRERNLSTNKILISDGQFKHSNDLLEITIYFYNRQLSNYKEIISKRYKELYKTDYFKKKLLLIKNKSLSILKKEIEVKELLFKTLNKKPSLTIDYTKYYKNFIKKSLAKDIVYLYFKQLIFINKFKFNNYYLQYLTNLVKIIYKKNVRFNFINVKYFYMNSDIFTQSLILKLKRNRRKLFTYLKSSVRKVKVHNKRKDFFKQDWENTENLKEFVLNNIEYKKVQGVRLQVAGRLTKRNTASRSLSRLEYKGSLINNISRIKGKPSAILRGKYLPNLEYTNLNSKTRIGSFGLKGWISGG